MFKWMSAFALAMLVCAPALAEEMEYRPGYYQYYYSFGSQGQPVLQAQYLYHYVYPRKIEEKKDPKSKP